MSTHRRQKSSRRGKSNDGNSSRKGHVLTSASAESLAPSTGDTPTEGHRKRHHRHSRHQSRSHERTRARRSQNNRRTRQRIFIFFAFAFFFLPVLLFAQIATRSAALDAPDYFVEQSTPVLGLAQGHKILGGPEDLQITSAAINPVPSMFFLPLGKMANPEDLLARAALFIPAFVLVPLFIVFFVQTLRCEDIALRQFGMFSGLSLVLIPALAFSELRIALFLPGPYPIALASILLASVFIAYGGTKSLYYFANLAGLLTALASWLEPAAAATFFAIVIYLLATNRFIDIRRFVIAYLGFGLVFGLFVGIIFGFGEMRFNLVDIALRAPFASWSDEGFFNSWVDGYTAALKHLLRGWGWILIPALVIIRQAYKEVRRARKRPGKERFGPLTAGVLCLGAIATLPFIPITMIRIGGNPYAPALFIFPVCVAIGLVILSAWLHHPPGNRITRFAIAAVFLVGVLAPVVRESIRLIQNESPWSPRLTSVFIALKTEPGWYYAPFDPLAHLLAEKRLYPNGTAMDRHRYASPEPITVSIRDLVPLPRRKIVLPENPEGHPSLGFIRLYFPYHDQPATTEPEDPNIPVLSYLEIPPDQYELLLRRREPR